MLTSLFRRSILNGRQLIKRGGGHAQEAHGHEGGYGHHHELTVFTDGPPSKAQVLRWIGFLTLGPLSTLGSLYLLYVGPRIRAKWAAEK